MRRHRIKSVKYWQKSSKVILQERRSRGGVHREELSLKGRTLNRFKNRGQLKPGTKKRGHRKLRLRFSGVDTGCSWAKQKYFYLLQYCKDGKTVLLFYRCMTFFSSCYWLVRHDTSDPPVVHPLFLQGSSLKVLTRTRRRPARWRPASPSHSCWPCSIPQNCKKKKKHKRKMNLFKLVKTSFCKYPQQVTEQRNLCCFISSFSDHSVDNKASVRTQTVQALQQISLLILRPPNVAGNCPLRALLC